MKTHIFLLLALAAALLTPGRADVASAVSSGTPLDTRAGQLTMKLADIPKSIADNALAASSLMVGNLVGSIADVNVNLDVTHTNDADLSVWLVGPQGTRVKLLAKAGGTGDNLTATVLDDEAATAIASGTAPFTGSFRPAEPLSAFDGQDPNGSWTLEVLDDTSNNIGTLTHWSLRFTINQAPATVMVTTVSPLPAWPAAVAYSRTLTALGGTPPYTWSRVSGALPAGLTLTPATGIISGTPTTSGLSVFRVQVTDADSQSVTKDLSLTIRSDCAALVLGTASGGTISPAGEIDALTFYGRAGRLVTVVVNPGSAGVGVPQAPFLNRVRAELRDPGGTLLASGDHTAAGQVLVLTNVALAADGTYSLRIKAPADASTATGNYTVTVWDATPDISPLVLNSQYTGRIDNPYHIDRWTFIAAAGQQVRFNLLSAANNGTGFDLTGPGAWTGLTNLTDDSALITLPSAGSYTFSAHSLGRAYGAGYTFKLEETAQSPLIAGVPLTGQFTGSGQARIFALTVATGMPLLLDLANAGAGNQIEIYAKYGAPPTRADFDYKFGTPASSNQSILIPTAVAGTWYILVYGDYIPTPGDYTLTATLNEVFLTGVAPPRLGNTTDAMLTLTGVGFDQQTAVTLVAAGGSTYQASTIGSASATSMTATFAAGSVPPGHYTVRATAAGGGTADLPGAFEMLYGGNPRFEHKIVLPGSIGYNRPATIYVDYSNTGTVAMPAPLLKVSVTQNGVQGAFLTLDPDLFASGFWSASLTTGFRHSVQILASGAVPGLLQPGEAIRVPVYYAGWQTPWDLSRSNMTFSASVVTADNATPVNWSAEFSAPAGMPAAEWQTILNNVTDNLGTTWGDYVLAIGETAAAQAFYGNENVRDADYLQGILRAQAGLNAQPGGSPPGVQWLPSDPYEPGTVLRYTGSPIPDREWTVATPPDGADPDPLIPARKTVVIIHGINNQVNAPDTVWVKHMAGRILAAEGGSANVLAVDWGRYAHPPFVNAPVNNGYASSSPDHVLRDHSCVPEIAAKVARRLFASVADGGLGLWPEATHLIGHSAGAHIAQLTGIFSRHPQARFNWLEYFLGGAYGTVARITLLDPSPDNVNQWFGTTGLEDHYHRQIAGFIDCYKSSDSFSGYANWGTDNFVISKGDRGSGALSVKFGSPLGNEPGWLVPWDRSNPRFAEQLDRHEDAPLWYLTTITPRPQSRSFNLGYWWDSTGWANATGMVQNCQSRRTQATERGDWLGIIDENTGTICGLAPRTENDPVTGLEYDTWEYPGVWPGSHSGDEKDQVLAMVSDLQRSVELYVVPEPNGIPTQWSADEALPINFGVRNNDAAVIVPAATTEVGQYMQKVPYLVWLAKTGDLQLTGPKMLLDPGEVDIWKLKAMDIDPAHVTQKRIKMPSRSEVESFLDANKQALLVIEINPAQGSKLLELYQPNNTYATTITVDGQADVTADAGHDQRFDNITTPTVMVTLDGTNSGPDNQIAAGSYVWTENGQVLSQGFDTFSTPLHVGEHEIVLTIKDLQGGTASDSTHVSIKASLEPPWKPGDPTTLRPVLSWDPNGLTGPAGYGAANHLPMNLALPYRIDFENESTASAPAQQVTITNQLSAQVDWSSFRLTEIGFGDQLIVVPPGSRYYQTTVPMTYDGVTFDVRIEAGINSSNGEVYAHFQSIDPVTNLPPEALTGFLPPEDGTGRGMGHVSYSVVPKANSASGTAIRNIAHISFDGQPIIATNQIDPHNAGAGTDPNKEALVTLDDGAPAVTLTLTPTGAGGTNVDVRWTGDDRGGVGVKAYNVAVSLDGGKFVDWLTGTVQTQATYRGYFGQVLEFRVTAGDFLGQEASVTGSTVIIDDDYLHWRAEHFGNAVGDPALRNSLWGDDADPDGDGRSNLMEFLAATDPLVADAQFNPTTRSVGGSQIYSYRETQVANHLVDHFLEWSPDGIRWFTGGLVFRVVGDFSDYRQMEAVLALNGQTPVQIRQVAKRDVVYSHWIYEEGAAFSQRGQFEDPNGDRIPNAVAYALGLPAVGPVPAADQARLPKAFVDLSARDPLDRRGGIEMRLPEPMQPDVTLFVEASPTLATNTWSEVARRTGTGGWQVAGALHPKVRTQTSGGLAVTTVTEDLSARRYYRLRAVVSE